MKQGDHVRWYVATLGDFNNAHTPHWHGNTVLVAGQRTDVLRYIRPNDHCRMVPDAPESGSTIATSAITCWPEWLRGTKCSHASKRSLDLFSRKQMAELQTGERESLYCPACEVEVTDPLVCGDCGAVICRKCGTPWKRLMSSESDEPQLAIIHSKAPGVTDTWHLTPSSQYAASALAAATMSAGWGSTASSWVG